MVGIGLLIGFVVVDRIIDEYSYVEEFGDLVEEGYNIGIW